MDAIGGFCPLWQQVIRTGCLWFGSLTLHPGLRPHWSYTQIPVIFRGFCPRGLLVCLLLVLEDQSEHSRSSPEALASAKKLHGYAVFAPGSMDSRAVFQNFNGREQESGYSLVGLAQIPIGNALARRNGSVDASHDAVYTATLAWLFLSLGFPRNPQLQLSSTRRLTTNDCHALVIQLASTPCP